MAVHKSNLDLCHHHAMFEYCIILNYASAFFLLIVLFGFAASTATGAAATAGFVDAFRLNLSFIAFLSLELPNEPLAIFPFFDFLSPLPINQLISLEEQL
jgi:hypothetical protein